jgi:hypothetical protein
MVALASAIGTSSLKTCWYPPLLATFVSHAYGLIIGVGNLSAVAHRTEQFSEKLVF